MGKFGSKKQKKLGYPTRGLGDIRIFVIFVYKPYVTGKLITQRDMQKTAVFCTPLKLFQNFKFLVKLRSRVEKCTKIFEQILKNKNVTDIDISKNPKFGLFLIICDIDSFTVVFTNYAQNTNTQSQIMILFCMQRVHLRFRTPFGIPGATFHHFDTILWVL